MDTRDSYITGVLGWTPAISKSWVSTAIHTGLTGHQRLLNCGCPLYGHPRFNYRWCSSVTNSHFNFNFYTVSAFSPLNHTSWMFSAYLRLNCTTYFVSRMLLLSPINKRKSYENAQVQTQTKMAALTYFWNWLSYLPHTYRELVYWTPVI